MKKLGKLTLKELGESAFVLDQKGAVGLKGGEGELAYITRYGTYLPDGTSYDPFRDVCYPTNTNPEATSYDPNQTTISQGPCPACERLHYANEHNSLGGVDGENVWTPFGEWLFITVPHDLGILGHTNGSE